MTWLRACDVRFTHNVMMIATAVVCVPAANCAKAIPADARELAGVKRFLREHLQVWDAAPDGPTRVVIAFADLKGDGQRDAVTYVSGGGYCGGGGCTTLVLVPHRASYDVVMHQPITIRPIKLLRTSTNGWRDISVVRKGDIHGDRFDHPENVISFTGKRYRSHHSWRRSGQAGDQVLISGDDNGTPLFP